MSKLRESFWRRVLVLGTIPLVVSTHWLVPRPDKQIHNLMYHLDAIPLLAAAMLFGWRTALAGTALTLLAELPQLYHFWPNDVTYRFDQIGETLVSGIAGVVVGLLSDRSARQKTKLETASRELERVNSELQQNIEKLKKAERLYAVGQMSATLAHEIRNPLASLAGAAGILKRGNANAANARECYEIIDRESQRLNKLLADFLSFARPRPPRLQPTDLAAVIDSVIMLARHSPEAAGIAFRRAVDHDVPEVLCDSEQIKQVLLNLVMNAAQATRRGVVDIEVALRGDAIGISVRDQGAGIPKDQEERIFEPFFTTKETGSGLGLAIAAQIAEQHGGTVTAQNNPGKGVTMTLELPITTAAQVGA